MAISRKNLGKLLIIISLLLFIIAIIVVTLPEKNAKINEKLNEEQQKYLFKSAHKYLTISNNLVNGSIEPEAMIRFALAYMQTLEGYKERITYDAENDISIAKYEDVKKYVDFIFDIKDINIGDTELKLVNEYIYIPTNTQGGDAKIYSYNKTAYNEQENTYVAYIDILESIGPTSIEQLQNPLSSYPEEYVIATMMFKYTVREDRKVLLAFNIETEYGD